MSQEANILSYLQEGNRLTPMDALRLFNCWALSSRISDLNKNGAGIKSRLIKGNGKIYAEYYLDPTPMSALRSPAAIQSWHNQQDRFFFV